jgi:hypothetical protein
VWEQRRPWVGRCVPRDSKANDEQVAARDKRVCHGACEEEEQAPRQPRSHVSSHVRRMDVMPER